MVRAFLEGYKKWLRDSKKLVNNKDNIFEKTSKMTISNSSRMMMENGDGGGSCLPCTPEEERQIVADLMIQSESDLRQGNLYFIISTRWFESWKIYVGKDIYDCLMGKQSPHSLHTNGATSLMADRPGPIDNSYIVERGEECEGNDLGVIRTLEEVRDYVLVPQKVWEKLFEWYKGGPALPRKLIENGVYSKSFTVEVYPLCLKLVDSRNQSQSIIRISKKSSIRDLYEKVCTLKGIKQGMAHIWDYFNKQKELELVISDQSLEDANLQMDQEILMEVEVDKYHSSRFDMDSTGNELALVPLEPARSSLTIAGGPAMSNGHSTDYKFNLYQGSALGSSFTDMDEGQGTYSSGRKGEKGGLAGLQNLGNTCFMNSALQCLAHTPPIVEYFLQDYSDEINMDNPLGMHGELALAFGELLRKLWSSGATTVPPRAFKGKLVRFAPQFSGYNQHDSQELLAFLLDGLHEDLNRVKQKPYMEIKDSDGRPDEVVAQECWNNHKARNDSLIVDVCQGQYKSTLVCPDCGKISITFDPFMYLSLPLPSTATRTMTVTVFYGDGSGLPMPYTVSVLKHGSYKDLSQALGAACCLKGDESLLLAEVYDNQIFRFLENLFEPLNSIKDDDYIVAYRLNKKGAGKRKLVIMHRWQEKCASDYLKSGDRKVSGTPLVTYLGEDPPSRADIEIAVARLLSPLRRTYSSPAKAHGDKENGFHSEAIDEHSNSCNSELGPMKQSPENSDLEDTSCRESLFHLFLSDERPMNFKPIQKDSILKYGQVLKVLLDWTDKEHESYDASYLKDLPVVHKTGFTVKKTRQESISLFSCLDAFLTEEPLGPDDMWYCPSCKAHRQATKKLDLWALPEILIFHLKRFSFSRYLKNKLDTFVNFPIHDLDLTKYLKGYKDGRSHVYELYAISNHYGGLGGGHYTAYAKLIDENRWYHFDDSHVSPVGENEIRTSAAYLLLYRRVESGAKVEVGETSQQSL
ncbi:UCH domain-containing protein/DUSP domain-containing protein [Cephalotus follicularis]|uniref:Ubiquitin carboxyl-terminal hydrolase n=1 Tax=Cephalotus follicularis TaxID=3775 RepID=A0A1Q3C4E3_CEPFO|nr:UCH domain-containing protein/DUSP domain-containing protein [Cephalotus follicularis]